MTDERDTDTDPDPEAARRRAETEARADRAEAERAARARHLEDAERPAHCVGFTLWKRPTARAYLSRPGGPPPRFHARLDRAIDAACADGGRVCAWGPRAPLDTLERAAAAGADAWLIEDGFLRSVGLGQDLQAPASLTFDPLGAHYDARRPSALEALIAAQAAAEPDPALRRRAGRLRAEILRAGVGKYTAAERSPPTSAATPAATPVDGRAVLVAGQVETDAAVRLGAAEGDEAVRANAALLRLARAARPAARLIWRPHPDVAAGYRPGRVPREIEALADRIEPDADAAALLDQVDEVWTITSLMGFEALLRGKRVVCLGWPFYAGWGLTEDLAAPGAAERAGLPHGVGRPPRGLVERRAARPDLETLFAAAYLLYPRYVDPATGAPCAAETVLERLGARDPAWGRPASPAIRAAAALRRAAAGLAARFGRSL